MSAVERDLRALLDVVQMERDELRRAWDMEIEDRRERAAESRALRKERDAALKGVEETERENRELQIENRSLRAIADGHARFPSDAHPLISALMERMVRAMGLEAGGGACNPHAVVCAALDAAHSFAEQDGSPSTAKLRDIVRVSAADVERLRERERDAETYHAEWMRQRALADALAEQIGNAASKQAMKRARRAVAMADRVRGRIMEKLCEEEYDEEDPATDGEPCGEDDLMDDDAF